MTIFFAKLLRQNDAKLQSAVLILGYPVQIHGDVGLDH
jgi:hypothetical protein